VVPDTAGPKPIEPNHDPIRCTAEGPLSQRLVSRSAPQIAQPAANGWTRSPQFGHRLRSRDIRPAGYLSSCVLSAANRSRQNTFRRAASSASGSRSCESATVLLASPLASQSTITRVEPSSQS
jgi:hypothetical protein